VNDRPASQNYQMKVLMEILVDSSGLDSYFESDLLFSLLVNNINYFTL